MDEQQARALLKKYTDGTATPEEKQQVENYYFRYLKKKHNLPGQKRLVDDQAAIRSALQRHIDNNEPVELPRRRAVWPRIAAAASVAILLSASGYFILHKKQPAQQFAQNHQPDIKPGGNKAILTLSNGKQISLTDAKNGKLAVQANTVIKKTADGKVEYANEQTTTASNKPAEPEYNTMTTPRGGRYEGTLADGTQFVLDAASSIRFPVKFTGKERLITVTGQVWIKVKYDAAHPFRVKVKGQLLEDLGTEFNINTYDDEPAMRTTLVEGSIRVSSGKQAVTLIPGQQAVNDNQAIKVQKADIANVIAWKNGQTLFNGQDIHEIMRNVSRWYDVDIRYEGEIPNRQFAGSISRNANLSDLLNILEFDNVHFRVDGKTIIVKP
jgi:transmembrane sensor